ncbi:MAG: type I-B CRISPR-associated endonuclease Cas1b, partial [candidate division WOR-3 bacterium]
MARNYYIFKNGRIKRSENTLVLETTEGKKFIPINDVDQIFVFGEVDFNSSFINLVSQSKITVHFFNYYGYYTGSFIPRETNVSGYLILKQVEHYIDKDKRIKLASSFVESACHNMKRNLEKREGFDNEIEKITEYMERIKDAPDITSLMSIEAHVRKIYYGCIEKLTEWEFDIRTIRPPKNPLNAMISFGNSLLYAQILKQIYETPLNPTISYLHEPSERRFSLALDVSEIFKPILVDRLILKLINTKII